jgi:hypothetical protein
VLSNFLVGQRQAVNVSQSVFYRLQAEKNTLADFAEQSKLKEKVK